MTERLPLVNAGKFLVVPEECATTADAHRAQMTRRTVPRRPPCQLMGRCEYLLRARANSDVTGATMNSTSSQYIQTQSELKLASEQSKRRSRGHHLFIHVNSHTINQL